MRFENICLIHVRLEYSIYSFMKRNYYLSKRVYRQLINESHLPTMDRSLIEVLTFSRYTSTTTKIVYFMYEHSNVRNQVLLRTRQQRHSVFAIHNIPIIHIAQNA